MKAENNIIALIVAIRNFLESLKDIHLKPCRCLRSISGAGVTWSRNHASTSVVTYV